MGQFDDCYVPCNVCGINFDVCMHTFAEHSQQPNKSRASKDLDAKIRKIVREELAKNENSKSVMPPSFC